MENTLQSVGAAINNAASYTAGQCTWYVASMLSWVPKGWGNAGEWFGKAQSQGFSTSTAPIIGSIVVYKPGSGYSSFGHVGIVTNVSPDGSFDVSEMNATKGPFQTDVRHSSMGGVAGFILPPSGTSTSVNAGASDGMPSWITKPLNILGVPDLASFLERSALILVGIGLLVIGIAITFRVPEKVVVAGKLAATAAEVAA